MSINDNLIINNGNNNGNNNTDSDGIKKLTEYLKQTRRQAEIAIETLNNKVIELQQQNDILLQQNEIRTKERDHFYKLSEQFKNENSTKFQLRERDEWKGLLESMQNDRNRINNELMGKNNEIILLKNEIINLKNMIETGVGNNMNVGENSSGSSSSSSSSNEQFVHPQNMSNNNSHHNNTTNSNSSISSSAEMTSVLNQNNNSSSINDNNTTVGSPNPTTTPGTSTGASSTTVVVSAGSRNSSSSGTILSLPSSLVTSFINLLVPYGNGASSANSNIGSIPIVV